MVVDCIKQIPGYKEALTGPLLLSHPLLSMNISPPPSAMARYFILQHRVEGYTKASDLEHLSLEWIHPNDTKQAKGYAKDEIIITISAGTSTRAGKKYNVGAVFAGPDNDFNKYINAAFLSATVRDAAFAAGFEAVDKAYTCRMGGLPFVSMGMGVSVNGMPGEEVKGVIIKSDSEFLEEVMTAEGLAKLKGNGWKLRDGMVLKGEYKKMALRMEEKIRELLGLQLGVWFWKVSPEENSDCHEMEQEAYLHPGC
ncbi:hypothetical protein F5Y15DRAFT_218381 [Xylariaceae sp. FL0016]|nr:hypothetical protein F5Y15DRAFT_218381 [Xylariaceae sp. FL0016]